MPTMKEFTVHLEDRPGTLGMLCRALSDKGVNIVAFQSNPDEKGKSTVRLVTDNPNATEAVLESEHTTPHGNAGGGSEAPEPFRGACRRGRETR